MAWSRIYHMAIGCGNYFNSNIFVVLALAMDWQRQGFFATNRIPKNQTLVILIEPVLIFYLPQQFIRHLRGSA